MKPLAKGLLVGALQLFLVLSLSAKLMYERKTRPRGWARCQVYDPEFPIRGRYLAEQLVTPAQGFTYTEASRPNISAWYLNRQWAYWVVRNGQLTAESRGSGSGAWIHLQKEKDGTLSAMTEEQVLIFIPDTAKIPNPKPGEETWVEVTIPEKGPPRPIQIALKANGLLTPLHLN